MSVWHCPLLRLPLCACKNNPTKLTKSLLKILNRQYWSGLPQWRSAPLNHCRLWGPTGPIQPGSEPIFTADDEPILALPSLAECGSFILSIPDPLTKSRLSHLAFSRWQRREIPVGSSEPPDRPARSIKPILVSPKEIPSHKELGMPLNAYMLHSLAHVELNAIDLAWDTVVRFSECRVELGDQFFEDFARVADDESRHFAWCQQRLAELGFSYGDMPAHNFLWRECEKSSGDVSARLAVIPLVQEARGLDAGPRLVKKLVGFGDHRTSDIVSKIAEEEVAHVAVGVFWFIFVCQKMGRIPCPTFKAKKEKFHGYLQISLSKIKLQFLSQLLEILKEYNVELKGPFNFSARDEAGIPREWYDGSVADDKTLSRLSEVHGRLADIIAMEKENSSMNS